ncbi:MAG: hypothetical protein H0W28_09800 [Pyrinomonadaceae bacterium]|nr:hypothetical protein [Pyrinomonadaceae bacterium]
MSELLFDYRREDLYLSHCAHVLGPLRHTLEELAQRDLLASSVEALEKLGYRYNRSVEPGTDLITFVAPLIHSLLERCKQPSAFVVHHSYAANTLEAIAAGNRELLARARYFPAALLRRLELDHVPYWGSYTSGCTGLMSLVTLAAGIMRAVSTDRVLCLTADLKPSDTTYDGVREKLLTSDAASGFVVSREPQGYKVMGVAQYSSSREIIPWLEVVKRAVQMTQQLCKLTGVTSNGAAMICHYPNMFVEAWQLVSHFLKVPKENAIINGMAERAHCLSSDATISLETYEGSERGQLHAVYSFGSGLHLAIALLKQT